MSERSITNVCTEILEVMPEDDAKIFQKWLDGWYITISFRAPEAQYRSWGELAHYLKHFCKKEYSETVRKILIGKN